MQQKPDGSFPQNSDVTGKPVWTELQLDEVALPIVLAHLVGRDGPATYAHVKKAADFLVDFVDPDTGRPAPFTPQERWENQSGYSPNSIAAQIAGLVCAADMARRNGDPASARRWLAVADRWQAQVKRWTVTTNGPLSKRPYFLRLTKDGKPNTGPKYAIGDGGPTAVDQRRVVDPSFLDLVRFGILRPRRPGGPRRRWRSSTAGSRCAPRTVRSGTAPASTGTARRAPASEWTITDPGTHTTLGRGWPLLTGERGEYAVTAGARRGAVPAGDGARVRSVATCSRSRSGTAVRPPAGRAAGSARAPGRRPR